MNQADILKLVKEAQLYKIWSEFDKCDLWIASIDELTRFAELVAQHGRNNLTSWNPIETAPKDGTDVLVMYMNIDTQIVHNAFWLSDEGCNDNIVGWWTYEHSEASRILLDDWMTPTHWMPLPTPPELKDLK